MFVADQRNEPLVAEGLTGISLKKHTKTEKQHDYDHSTRIQPPPQHDDHG